MLKVEGCNLSTVSSISCGVFLTQPAPDGAICKNKGVMLDASLRIDVHIPIQSRSRFAATPLRVFFLKSIIYWESKGVTLRHTHTRTLTETPTEQLITCLFTRR